MSSFQLLQIDEDGSKVAFDIPDLCWTVFHLSDKDMSFHDDATTNSNQTDDCAGWIHRCSESTASKVRTAGITTA